MTDINEIKAMALAYGACDKALNITSIKDAVNLLLTPQGREFAVKSGFPTLEVWRSNAYEVDMTESVLLDMGMDNYSENQDYVVVGNTFLESKFDKPDALHHVIAMHGAKVHIKATGYAVITVSSYDAEVTVETDGTALVFVEESKKGGDK